MTSGQSAGPCSVYDDGLTTIYQGDARDILPRLQTAPSVLVTDPPYGIAYKSGQAGDLPRSIAGDEDTTLRDWAIDQWDGGPCLVFGTWRIPRPEGTHTRLIWDTKGALGMGDLSVPWKPSDQEIYVLGKGFEGHRGTNVLRVAPVQATARNGRVHPHEKPVALMRMLLEKVPPVYTIVDPFMGSGPTLRAAADLGRRAIGVELEPAYIEAAIARLGQGVLAA